MENVRKTENPALTVLEVRRESLENDSVDDIKVHKFKCLRVHFPDS